MPKSRRYRKRKGSDDEKAGENSDDDASTSFEDKRLCVALEDIRDLQKIRKKKAGLSASELALGTEIPQIVEMVSDPLKLKTGGMIDLKKIKSSDLSRADIEDDIRQTFSKESNLRDEDEEMRKYVEEQVAKRKGAKDSQTERNNEGNSGDGIIADDNLYQLPEQLKKYQSRKNEEMLSNQMLCGIPEVDLGIEAKIKNIEETEAAKLRLLKDAIEKRKNLEEVTTFHQNIVKDIAKDYVQHSLFDISDATDLALGKGVEEEVEDETKKPATEAVPVVGEDTPAWSRDGIRVDNPQDLPQTTKGPCINHVLFLIKLGCFAGLGAEGLKYYSCLVSAQSQNRR